ncbi:MAG: hypothetical protein P4L49_00890 [Desulfosporosinus sp.]|nr:hypothetical protein [Desulfosporosinus sp.]
MKKPNLNLPLPLKENYVGFYRRILITIFCLVFFLEMAGGIYYGYFQQIVLNDAFSRTANAYYVLFIKPVRFASIGLVWNPLPSVLQLPFVVFAKVWKPMVTNGISAALVTSAFAAGSCVLLYRAFLRYKISKFKAIILLVLYGSNPFIFFYGFNGMSEMIIFYMIIYVVLCLTLWIHEGTPSYIMKIGLTLALAFYCRYEAIPFAAAVGVGVLIIIFFSTKEKQFIPPSNRKERYFYAEGTGIILYTPLLYAIFVWIIFNWVINGNPLYFLNSAYSNSSQSQYAAFVGTPLTAFFYVLNKSLPFLPVFMAIIIVRIINRRLLKSDFLILLCLVATMILFHFLMLLIGNSFGWLRFFAYALPICMAWLPYELSQVKNKVKQTLVFVILAFSLLVSSILTGYYLASPELSPEEHNLIISSESRQVAEYINNNLQDELILVDSFLTGGVVLNIDNIDNIVTSASLNFYDVVDNPRKYGITYILVPDQSGIGHLDAINSKYPNLYANNVDWCVEVKDFDGYRLFKVIY